MKAPDSIKMHPFLRDWIDLSQPGLVVIHSGKAEIGQGIHFALSSIVSNILEVPLDRINVRGPDTDEGPNEGLTAGSLSVQQGGAAWFLREDGLIVPRVKLATNRGSEVALRFLRLVRTS